MIVSAELRCAFLALGLSCASVSLAHAQAAPVLRASGEPAATSSSLDRWSLLPDAPSAGLQQQTPPAATPAPPPENETPAERQARQRKESQDRLKAQEQQRLGGVIPNFNVVLNGEAPPLSAKQKYALAFHSVTDYFPFVTAAVLAGYSEAEDSHKGFAHGPSGYFKRFGASYGDNAIGTMVGNAVLPALLHQDPRYFRKGTGTIRSRIVYSALTTFICRGDNGKRQANVSNVLGNFISGGISNAYYPPDERGAALTIENASVVTVEGALGAQFLEFAPDIFGKLKRRRQGAAAAAVPAPSTAPATSAPPGSPTDAPK